ncbi:serine/threonine-protein kinase [Nocardiopsis sp. CC223A]|uniref:serine/threonine-protein kinase n=1 Tax=Nocardiopsis sp. CC223A TaxID=3044051 RepID=UPI00278C5B80|nr:serine/threonine protein kinase [Nocardiopsis sp. CC223A]
MPPTERIVASRYRLTGKLGSGGMGTVWQAFDPRLEREVAIKEVHLPTGLSDEEQRTAKARMMREARTAARIGHPSVVTVHDVLEEDGTPYIVMALLDGSSLEEVLEEAGPLPPARVARIARAVLEAPAPRPSAPGDPVPTAPVPPPPVAPDPAARTRRPGIRRRRARCPGTPRCGSRHSPPGPRAPQPGTPRPHRAAVGPVPSAHPGAAHPGPYPAAPRAAGYAPSAPMHAVPVRSVPRPAARSSRAGLWWGMGGGCLLLVIGLVTVFVIVPGAMRAAGGEGPGPLPTVGPTAEPSRGPGPDYTLFENEYVSLYRPADWEPLDPATAGQGGVLDVLAHHRFDSPDAARHIIVTVFSLDEESGAQATSEAQLGWEEALRSSDSLRDWERLGLEELTGLPTGQRGSDLEATFVTEGSGWDEPHRWMVWRYVVVDDATGYYLQFNGRAGDREEYRPVVDEVFASFAVTGT